MEFKEKFIGQPTKIHKSTYILIPYKKAKGIHPDKYYEVHIKEVGGQ